MQLIDGKSLSKKIQNSIKIEVEELKEKRNIVPGLAVNSSRRLEPRQGLTGPFTGPSQIGKGGRKKPLGEKESGLRGISLTSQLKPPFKGMALGGRAFKNSKEVGGIKVWRD